MEWGQACGRQGYKTTHNGSVTERKDHGATGTKQTDASVALRGTSTSFAARSFHGYHSLIELMPSLSNASHCLTASQSPIASLTSCGYCCLDNFTLVSFCDDLRHLIKAFMFTFLVYTRSMWHPCFCQKTTRLWLIPTPTPQIQS